MAKRVDPLKAKEAKQKKMAIGLSVLFVAVLAFQGPKTLKMLKGPSAATPAAAAAPTPTTSTTPAATGAAPVTPTIDGVPPSSGATAAAGAVQPAVLVNSDVPVEAADGQLTSFELFEAKDPFEPQNVASTVPASATGEKPGLTGAKPADGATVVPPASAGAGSPAPAAPPGTASPAAPAAPTTAAASATSISVNGAAEDIQPDVPFPAAAPAFVLVAVAKDGKSVQIGVAGGAYADGAKTIKLTLGKALTLRNTADGSEYVLLLNTVAGFAPPKK